MTAPQNWKLTARAPRAAIEAALIAHEDVEDWDYDIILAGSEIAAGPDWLLEAYLPRKPSRADRVAIAALFAPGIAPTFTAEHLPETDWVTASQAGLAPITAGAFCVHTPDHAPAAAPGIRRLCIPASRAFGTGHHETTAGCLAMLTLMRREGMVVRNLADIGTGTGLLALAALHLWPRALATATDIDDACLGVLAENTATNGVAFGARPGEITPIIADGMAHPLIAARAPYDLIIANILAGPLVALAPDFAAAMVPGASLLLAGLLATQEAEVRSACYRVGLRLARREQRGDWSILWLRKRVRPR